MLICIQCTYTQSHIYACIPNSSKAPICYIGILNFCYIFYYFLSYITKLGTINEPIGGYTYWWQSNYYDKANLSLVTWSSLPMYYNSNEVCFLVFIPTYIHKYIKKVSLSCIRCNQILMWTLQSTWYWRFSNDAFIDSDNLRSFYTLYTHKLLGFILL